jgi:hypothetical protein
LSYYSLQLDLLKVTEPWRAVEPKYIKKDVQGKPYLSVSNTATWVPSALFTTKLDSLYAFEFEFKSQKLDDETKIIVMVKQGNKDVYYAHTLLKDFVRSTPNHWAKASIAVANHIRTANFGKDLSVEFSCYVGQNTDIQLKNARISTLAPNKNIYSIVAPIK